MSCQGCDFWKKAYSEETDRRIRLESHLRMIVGFMDQISQCEDAELRLSFERALKRHVERMKNDPVYEGDGAEKETV
jgi:uncharacterized membrane-anchored protein YjiN (DUF445 family)